MYASLKRKSYNALHISLDKQYNTHMPCCCTQYHHIQS